MIKKLRRKFIVIAMLSVLVVLGGIIAVINIVNYCQINANADRILDVLVQNQGQFPPRDLPQKDENKPRLDFSPETPYETRYFTVTIFADGSTLANTGKIAAVSPAQAQQIALTVHESGAEQGRYRDYKYRATATDDGNAMYIFLDCSRDLNTFRNFLLYSSLISLGGLVLVFALVIVLSRFAIKPVEESYHKQKCFITNAGHDIKTPLTIIGADADVIELTNGKSEWSQDIKKQVARLTSLTDKLVFLAKMDENDQSLLMQPLDLSALLEEGCLAYESTAIARGLRLDVHIAPHISINGNEDALRRAVALVMDNAVHYAKSYIEVHLTRTGNTVELRLLNDADNVQQGNLDRLFDRFYRADASRNSQSGGHGIGLSVVKSIVTAHKGKVSAHSHDGKTVEFIICL